MYDNQVWDLIDPPEVAKVIECNWIFKEKVVGVFKEISRKRFQKSS